MNDELHILLLEDGEPDAELVMRQLRKCGLRFVARRVFTEAHYLIQLREFHPDVILADYSLPSYDGLSALAAARKICPEVPFIFVSATIGEEIAISALRDGATDYVLKHRLARVGSAVQRALREVEERKQRQWAEAELRRSEQRYREIFNATHEAIFVHDAATGAILDVNQTMLDMFGYARSDLADLSSDNFRGTEPYTHEEALRRIRLAATEGPQVFQWLSKRKNGEQFWTEVALRATSIGGEGRVLAVVRDISERKRAEAALVQAKEDWERTFDTVPDLITIIDNDHRVVRVNRAMTERLKRTSEQCVGHCCHEIVHGTDQPPDYCPHARLLRDGQEHQEEVCEAHLGGDFLVRTSPLRDAQGRMVGSVHVSRDITDRKRAEQALRESEARQRQLFAEATEGIVLADTETGEILDCNHAFEQMSGYSRSELIGRSQAMLHPQAEGAPTVSSTFAQHRAEREGDVLLSELLTQSGTVKLVEIKASGIEVAGRRIMQGFFRDVTAEQRYKHEREITLKLLRLLNDHNNTHELIGNLTAFLQEWTGCEAVGVRLKDGDDFPYFETRGFPAEFVRSENSLCARDALGQPQHDAQGNPILDCMCGNVLGARFDPSQPFFTAKGSFWTNCSTELLATTSEADRQVRTRNRCNGEGYESVGLFALRHGHQTLGLLQINDRAQGRFTPELIAFLEKTADQIAMALAQRQAQVAMRASEEQLRRLIEVSPDAIYIHRDQRFIFANQAGIQLLGGHHLEDLRGRPIHEFVHPDFRRVVTERVRDLTAPGTSAPLIEERFVRLDGTEVDVEVAAIAMHWDGQPAVQTVVRDITARKQAEARIHDLNQLLRAIRDVNTLIVHERDPQRLLREACEILVQTRGYLLVWIGGPAADSHRIIPVARAGRWADYLDHIIITTDDSPTGQGPVGTAWRTGRSWVCQDVATDPRFAPWRTRALGNGFAAMSSIPMAQEDRLFGVINVYADHANAFDAEEIGLLEELARDLAFALRNIEKEAESRRAETQIRAQASLLDLAQDAIMVRDLDDRILYWNRGAERLYGWSAQAAVGRKVTELYYREPASFLAAKERLLQTGRWTGELPQVTQDGREVMVSGRWTMVRDERGQPKSILIINTDITEKKKLEAQFLRAQRLESVGQLASGIAHDLNNILMPIMMLTPVLLETIHDPEMVSLVETMETSAKRGADIVKQVLTFSRGIVSQKAPLQTRHLVKEVAGIALETFPRSITVKTNAPSDLWLVEGDATQLHQVVMNLCVNARDAMPNGGVLTLAAENVRLDEEAASKMPHAKSGPHVVWTISDTGTGISAEVVDRIFDPFFTTKEPGRGTGLGLSTVLGIVRNHGGWVEVTSQPGQGSQFKVFLPAMTADSSAAPANDSTSAVRGRGELILVVDDEEPVRRLINHVLEQHGYRTLVAPGGEEGARLYAQQSKGIDLLLTDMDMPRPNGAALVQTVRQTNPEARIICMSGHPDRDGLEPPPATFLAKPFTPRELLHTIEQVLAEN